MPEDGSSPGAAFAPTSSRSSSSQTPESAGQDGRPQTPQHRRGHSEPHNAFSPKSPPTLPSPMTMNLYRLGIGSSPLSPLRRQFSSSFSHNNNPATLAKDRSADADDELSEEESETGDTSCDGDHDDDLTQDSKDVLVDRLNDILQRLSTGGGLGGANISILHGQVDEMEKVLASDHHKPSRPKTPRQRPSLLQLASPLPIVRSSSGTKISDDAQHPGYWGFTSTPPSRQPVPPFSEGSSPVITATAVDQLFISTTPPRFHGEDEESEMPSEVADSLVQEAEKLCKELNAVLKNLQDRREESDHINEMLIERAEAAAQRILELDDHVYALEDEIATNKSDLEHLRLQLRALEVLCYEYVPPDADRDLLQSIENWKSDYTRLKLKMESRRRERNPLSAAVSPSGPSVLSPSNSLLIERAGLF